MRHFLTILALLLGFAIIKPTPARAVFTMTYESPTPGDGAVTTDRHSPNNPIATASQNAQAAGAFMQSVIMTNTINNNGNPFAMTADYWEFSYRILLGWAIEMDYFEWSGGEGHP